MSFRSKYGIMGGKIYRRLESGALQDTSYNTSVFNDKYRAQAEAILRKYGNMSFNATAKQRLAIALGDYSSSDNFYDKLFQDRDTELQELLDAQRQEEANLEYTDPAFLKSRERAAGINTDLQGITSQAPGASDVPQDMTPSDLQPVDDGSGGPIGFLSSCIGLINSVPDTLSSALDVAAMVRDFCHVGRMNDLEEINGVMGSYQNVFQFASDLTSPFDWVAPDGKEFKAGERIPASYIHSFKSKLPISSRARKALGSMLGEVSFGPDGLGTSGFARRVSDNRRQTLENNKGSVEVIGSPYFDADFLNWAIGFSERYKKPLEDLKANLIAEQDRLARYNFVVHSDKAAESRRDADVAASEAEEARAGFEEDYFNKLDPDTASSSENAQKALAKSQAITLQYIETCRQEQEKIYHDAMEEAKKIRNPSLRVAEISHVVQTRAEFINTLDRLHEQAISQGQSDAFGLKDIGNMLTGGLPGISGSKKL